MFSPAAFLLDPSLLAVGFGAGLRCRCAGLCFLLWAPGVLLAALVVFLLFLFFFRIFLLAIFVVDAIFLLFLALFARASIALVVCLVLRELRVSKKVFIFVL